MIEFETKDGKQQIKVLFDETFDVEDLHHAKKAIRNAMVVMADNEIDYAEEIYYLNRLFDNLELSDSQEIEYSILQNISKQRKETIRKIIVHNKHNEELTKEEKELKSILF